MRLILVVSIIVIVLQWVFKYKMSTIILLDSGILGKGIIFKCLSTTECRKIISVCEDRVWEIQRHKNYPTIDQEINNIPELQHLVHKVESAVFATIRKKYGFRELKMNDLFVVKYDCIQQNKLDIHRDVSVLSFVITLNSDFKGGGTYFRTKNYVFNPSLGTIIIMCGKLLHGGLTITKGVRYILTGFVDILDDCIDYDFLDNRVTNNMSDYEVLKNMFKK